MRRQGLTVAILALVVALSGMSIAAAGAEAEPDGILVPTAPEQSFGGLRVVQPWSGTSLYIYEGWSVQTLQPEPDLGSIAAGQSWEALRLTSPLAERTCSMYVALAAEGRPSLERKPARVKARAIREPRWDLSAERPTLLYPDPAGRLASSDVWTDVEHQATTRACHPGIEHEMLQVWACAHTAGTKEPIPFSPDGWRRVIMPDPASSAAWGTMATSGQMLHPRTGFSATILPDGRVLVVGGAYGEAGKSAEIWDPGSRTFRPAGEMKRRRMAHTAVLQPDGGVLIVGGTGRFGQNIKDAELWDPTTSTFSSAGKLRTPRTATATVTGFSDGGALVVGGGRFPRGDPGPALRAEIWNPASGRFERAGLLDGPRVGHRTFALPDGDAMVIGPGRKKWLRWDARARTFEAVAQTDEPRSETHQLARGRLLAVGVTDEATCKKGKAYAGTPDAEVWLPRVGELRSGGAFKSPRYEATVTALPDGGALFYGGGIATCMDVARYPTAERWDPRARDFQRAGRTELPHWDEATALLADGRVAVIGGVGTENYSCTDALLGSIELWDPETGTFSVAGALAEPRSSATAITLEDGSVLILGGLDRWEEAVVSAELWVPPTSD